MASISKRSRRRRAKLSVAMVTQIGSRKRRGGTLQPVKTHVLRKSSADAEAERRAGQHGARGAAGG